MDAKRVEEAVEAYQTGKMQKEFMSIFYDLARSYLTAIKSGVPEEMKDYKEHALIEWSYIKGFNACREQMLPLIVERDREILELHTYIDNAFGKQTKGKPIVERVHDIVMELETVRNENQALLARVKDVEGWWKLFAEVFDCKPNREDCSFKHCGHFARCSRLYEAISKWLEGEGR